MSIANIARLAKVLSIPCTRMVKDGSSVVIDKLHEHDITEAYRMFMRYAADGDGVSKVGSSIYKYCFE